MSAYFAKYRGYMYTTVNWNLSNHSCPKTIYEIVLQSFFSVRSEKNFLLILFLVPGFMHFMEMKNKTIKCKQNVNFIFWLISITWMDDMVSLTYCLPSKFVQYFQSVKAIKKFVSIRVAWKRGNRQKVNMLFSHFFFKSFRCRFYDDRKYLLNIPFPTRGWIGWKKKLERHQYINRYLAARKVNSPINICVMCCWFTCFIHWHSRKWSGSSEVKNVYKARSPGIRKYCYIFGRFCGWQMYENLTINSVRVTIQKKHTDKSIKHAPVPGNETK